MRALTRITLTLSLVILCLVSASTTGRAIDLRTTLDGQTITRNRLRRGAPLPADGAIHPAAFQQGGETEGGAPAVPGPPAPGGQAGPDAEDLESLPQPDDAGGPTAPNSRVHPEGAAVPDAHFHPGHFPPGEFVEGEFVEGVPGIDGLGGFPSESFGPGGCSDCGGACGPGGCVVRGPRCWYGQLELLLWFSSGRELPPLVSDGPLPANILFGGERVGDDLRAGGRVTLGKWFNAHRSQGILARYFAVESADFGFDAESEGGVALARPFFNLAADLGGNIIGPDAQAVAGNGDPGTIAIRGGSDVFGIDFLYRGSLLDAGQMHLDFLVGYQMTRIDEELSIVSDTLVNNAVALNVTDQYATENHFHGAALGVMSHSRWRRFGVEVLAKLGLGTTKQRVLVSGSRTNGVGGLFAQPNNIGTFEKSAFTFVPEIGLNLHYRHCDRLNLSLGYSFMFWNVVSRPEDHLDPNLWVNANNPAGANEFPHPGFQFRDTSFWLQGVNFGIAYTF